MEPVTPRGWQAFLNHLADQARREQRDRNHEAIGCTLYAVVVSVIIIALVAGALQAIGWIK